MSHLSRFWLLLVMLVLLVGMMICPKFIESLLRDSDSDTPTNLYENEY